MVPETTLLFPLATAWPLYGAFIFGVLLLLALDLKLFKKSKAEMTLKSAFAWTAFWIFLAFLFDAWLYSYILHSGHNTSEAARIATEFITGFLVEKSLSLDNLFIFVMIFSFMQIEKRDQHRVLTYGILGAIVMRGVFIAAGNYLLHLHFMTNLFGIIIIVTGIKMFFAKTMTADRIQHSHTYKTLSRFSQNRFLLTILLIETFDMIFAIDSIPAVFSVTREPFLVFSSNIFAILGLRALYFVIAEMVSRFQYLRYGLAIILVFVGTKMLFFNDSIGASLPAIYTLAFIVVVIGATIVLSMIQSRRKKPT